MAGGALAESRGEGSVALGKDAQATGDYANAIGSSARATEWATAVGPGTQANGVASAAYGDGSVADGEKAIAMGSHATAKNESTIAIGNGAKVGATNGDVAATNGIAIGTKSESKDQQAIAVGNKAIAAGNNSIALGNETTTTGGNGVAIGNKASASADSAAIGNKASASAHSAAFGSEAEATAADGYSSAFGQKSKATAADASAFGNESKALATNATSVGAHSKVDTGATYGSALGRSANVSAANGTALGSSSSVTAADGTAVGTGATVSTAGGVALGQGSKSTRAALDGGSITISSVGNVILSNHITDKDITDKDNSTVHDVYAPVKLINDKSILERVKNTIKGTAGAVSLGNNTTTRQLTNLAPGSADYDAVNVAQLKAVVGTIKHYNVISKDGDITINPDTTDPNKTVWDLKINPKYKIKYFSVKSEGDANENNDGATATDAIAIGKNASSTGSNAVSLGLGAKALGNNNTAIGPGAQAKDVRTTAIGYNAKAEAASAVGIGYEANATQSRSLAIGQDATATANNAIALGSSGQHSENKTTASAEHAVAIGSGAVANITNGIALGSQSKTTAASGQTGFDASQDVEGARVNTYKDLTNNKKNVRTSTLAGLSIGDTDKTRQINHLAAGTADDDAVNVAQLKSVNLAFKGDNNTKGDVRLHDQRLSVVGATGSFITTKANGNKLEISTTQGTFSTTNGKSSSTASGLATTNAVADTINKTYWQLQADGSQVGDVNPGDKVNIASGNGITVTPTTEANGVSKITINATVAGIKAGHNVTVKTTDGVSTINAIDTNTQASVSKLNDNSPITIDSSATNAAGAKDYKLDVNVDGTTISKAGGTLHAETGAIEEVTTTTGDNAKKKGQVQAKPNDENKVATVSNVANAINKAKWFAKADNNGGEIADNAKTNDADDADGQAMGAGDKLTLKAGKNLRVKRDGANFTFATDNDVTFNKVTSGEVAINNGGKLTVGTGATINMGGNVVGGVAKGVADTDAVNVAQLKSTERHITPTTYTYNETDKSVTLTYTDGNGKVVANTKAKIDLSGLANKIKDYSFKTNATGSNLVGTVIDTTVASGKSVNFAASDNLTLKQDVKDGNVTYTYGLKNQVVVGEKGTPGADGKPGKDGVDGSIGVNGKDGSAVAINGKDGSIGLNGKDGKNGLTIKGQDGKVGVDGKDGETRLVYVEKADPTKPGSSDKTHELATLDDGMKYGGDIGEVANVKLNKQVDIKGGVTDKTKLSDNNIGVISTPNATTGGTELTVKLAKELKGLTSAEFKGGDDGAVTNITNSGITIKPANSNDDSKTVSLTNTGLNNGGNKITHVAEGKDDTDAVNVKQLKDFKSEVAEGGLTFAGNSGTDHKAKLNSTVNIKGAEGNTDANQFDNGKNVMTAVNGNTVTVSIKKTPEVEGINITDTTGNVKVKLTQTNEGLKVSDNNDQATRITNVKAGKKDTDAVNVKQLNAAKTEVTAGDNIDVRSSTGANGQTIYKVSANDTSAAVEAGSDHVKVTKAANTHKDGSTTVTDYTVDLSEETKNTIRDTHKKVTDEGLTFNADKGTTGVKKLGSKVSVNGDGKNITTTADENGVKVSMKDDIKVNSVTAKEVKVGDVNINENGINAGGKRITNVAPGKDGTDAVNVNQLKYVAGNISNQINNVDKGLRAGIAGALASGGLYHVTTAGKSMVSVGAGTYRGQNALAVGYSRLSDNGKVGVKFTVNSNSQGHSGASASVGYQW